MKLSRNRLAVALLIMLIVTVAVISYTLFESTTSKQFYVGVTYCGNSEQEAMLLIDKVKDYSNLFVLQSGSLQYNLAAVEQICDYAVNSGLNVIVYFSVNEVQQNASISFVNTAQERWGNNFLGLYFGDEPGGKMLGSLLGWGQSPMDLGYIPSLGGNFSMSYLGFSVKQQNGSIAITRTFEFSGEIHLTYMDVVNSNTTSITYFTNGTIRRGYSFFGDDAAINEFLIYYPNGTVTLQKGASAPYIVTDRGNISQFEPYQQVWDSRTLPTYDEIATAHIESKQSPLEWIHNKVEVNIFTSDFALYWWDYQIGYDIVLAQLGWNHTLAQDIALVRGAAQTQNKNWGTIITWKYNNSPYLDSGEAIYEQMRMSYECGAEYVIIFNYAEDMQGPYGTLQEEHFQALERFWNEVVSSPEVKQGSVKAEAVLVLPRNYGWGMRNPDDTLWGLWNGDENSQQIWQISRNLLDQYDYGLDIVYDDPAYPVNGKYSKIFYWNQTS
ncbi:MAG: hypothetical protein NWF06_00355 [Candidatus Bathyarchaeota archaeon]|nr:hypothetical protein [Candidatus Bathyarchaeum sp.]